jgi:hypothetical protein
VLIEMLAKARDHRVALLARQRRGEELHHPRIRIHRSKGQQVLFAPVAEE